METNFIRLMHGWNQQVLAIDLASVNPWLWLGIFLGLAVTGGLAYRVRYWWKEGRKLVTEPGHISPRAPIFARITRFLLLSYVRRRYCGPTIVLGTEHMHDERRLMILINHQTERDAIAIPPSLRLRVVRTLMAVSQITGIRVPLASWLGILAVHHDKNPSASVRSMIKALQQDEDSDGIIFPQGELHRDNVLKREQFFDGAMMIVKKATGVPRHAKGEADAPAETAKPRRKFAVLPAAVAYDRDPSHATLVQRFFEGIGWKKFRSFYGETIYGCCIVYGTPIPVESLPEKYDEAMTVIFNEIVKLSAQAEAALKRSTKTKVA